MFDAADTIFFRNEPASDLANIIDVVLFDMSGDRSTEEIQEWKVILLSRADSESEEIKEAVAVCDDFLRSLREDQQSNPTLRSDRGKCQS